MEKFQIVSELIKARENNYALGAFNTSNLEVTKAICRAVKKADFPAIIQTSQSSIEYAGMKTLFDIVLNEVENSGIRAIIHLDHGKDIALVKEAIDLGYPSVMFDGSKLSFDENVRLTKEIVDYAKPKGVAVEGEIGIISREEGGRLSGQSEISDPLEAKKFVELTGIDSVAVSVGNEHGAPEGEKVNLALLKEISDVIKIPLVMHGASGLSNRDIHEAIVLGVTKFNIDTKIKQAFTEEIESSNEEDYRKVFENGMEEVENIVLRYINLFRNE